MSPRITEKNPCGLTLWQRLKCWFWGTRVGVALHALMGRPTAYKMTIEGTLIARDNLLVVDCFIRVGEDTYDQPYLSMKKLNG